jgi:hypothetical protein
MDRVAEVPSTSRMKERYKGKCHVSERAGLLSCADLRVKQKQLRRRMLTLQTESAELYGRTEPIAATEEPLCGPDYQCHETSPYRI